MQNYKNYLLSKDAINILDGLRIYYHFKNDIMFVYLNNILYSVSQIILSQDYMESIYLNNGCGIFRISFYKFCSCTKTTNEVRKEKLLKLLK